MNNVFCFGPVWRKDRQDKRGDTVVDLGSGADNDAFLLPLRQELLQTFTLRKINSTAANGRLTIWRGDEYLLSLLFANQQQFGLDFYY